MCSCRWPCPERNASSKMHNIVLELGHVVCIIPCACSILNFCTFDMHNTYNVWENPNYGHSCYLIKILQCLKIRVCIIIWSGGNYDRLLPNTLLLQSLVTNLVSWKFRNWQYLLVLIVCMYIKYFFLNIIFDTMTLAAGTPVCMSSNIPAQYRL